MNIISWQPGVTLAMVEQDIILKAYNYFEKNKTRTADSLGIAVRTLDAKLAQYEEKANAKLLQAEAKHGVEPTAKVPEEPTMPVHEREEVQKVPPPKHAKGGNKRASA